MPLRSREEERAVLPDRPAQRKAELISDEHRPFRAAAIVEEVIRIVGGVPVELEQVPVELVAPGFYEDLHLGA